MPIKPIFSRNDNISKISFLNWRMESDSILNLFNLGYGYLNSAIILIEKCLEDNADKKADILIFPIFTGVNHGVEVYLKGLTLLINTILGNGLFIDGTHNLNQLFSTLKARIRDLDGQNKLNEFENEFEELSSYIIELNDKLEASQKNDKMDFSRYPFSRNKENHFYANSWKNIEVDLVNFRNRILIIKEKLQQYSDFLYFNRYQNEN